MQRQKIRNKILRENSGFTLIEIVLVMFIVSLTFTGIYSVLAKTSQHEKDNRYALIAANLAQEGVEIVRNKRDNNLLADWNSRKTGGAGVLMNKDLSSGTCYPYWEGTETKCDSSRKAEVRIDTSGGKKVYRNCPASGVCTNLTIFKRSCNIISTSSTEIKVKCTVTWQSPSLNIPKKVEMESLLTNWQQNL